MNHDCAIGPSAADARREARVWIPMLQMPRNRADAALMAMPPGVGNGLSAPFSAFGVLCRAVQRALWLNAVFTG